MDDTFNSIFNGTFEDSKIEEAVETTPETETVETVEETVEAPVETVETVETETVEDKPEAVTEEVTQKEEPLRDDKGRFANPNAPVPLNALRTVRARAQSAEARAMEAEQRAAEFEEKIRELEAQSNDPEQLWNDPEAFRNKLIEDARAEAKREFDRLQAEARQSEQEKRAAAMSENLAAVWENYTEEQRTAAFEYAGALADQGNQQAVEDAMRKPDPIADFLEQKTRQEQALADWEEFTRDREAFIRREAARLTVEAPQVAPATQPQMAATAKRPVSLSSAGTSSVPSATQATGDAAFNAIFNNHR